MLFAVLMSSATAFAADTPDSSSKAQDIPSSSDSDAAMKPPASNSALKDEDSDVPPSSKKNAATDQPALERDK
jgi:hypothetical protein